MAVYTFNPDANPETTTVDGRVHNFDAVWATARAASSGQSADDTDTQITLGVTGKLGGGQFFISRGFLLFNTASIPDTHTIVSATLALYAVSTQNGDNDGDDWLNVCSTTPASNTGLVLGDFDQVGSTELANRIDIGSISTSAYNTWTLNASGLAAISKTGVTKLGLREGHDFLDSAYAGSNNTFNEVTFHMADGSNKPVLTVITAEGHLALLGVG